MNNFKNRKQISSRKAKDLGINDITYWSQAGMAEKKQAIAYLRESVFGPKATTGKLQKLYCEVLRGGKRPASIDNKAMLDEKIAIIAIEGVINSLAIYFDNDFLAFKGNNSIKLTLSKLKLFQPLKLKFEIKQVLEAAAFIATQALGETYQKQGYKVKVAFDSRQAFFYLATPKLDKNDISQNFTGTVMNVLSAEGFSEALQQIYDYCEKNGLSNDDARILSYIHAKIIESNDKYYFNKEQPTDVAAIELMLGQKENSSINSDGLRNKLSDLEVPAKSEYGIEKRVSTEVTNRLRLYQKKKYRNKMMGIYKKISHSSILSNEAVETDNSQNI